jgi:hypothetical protein
MAANEAAATERPAGATSVLKYHKGKEGCSGIEWQR